VTTADGRVIGTTKIVDNGSPAERWNLVFLGDGYQDSQIPDYGVDVQRVVDVLFQTPPFDRVRPGINVFRVDVASTDSGADDPVDCGGTGQTARTYFDASFCNNGIQRLLVADAGTALTVASAEVPEWHALLMVVNSPIYGGSGGIVGVFSLAPQADEIALHEMGHSAFALADEYEFYFGCGIDIDRDRHPGFEPFEANVTTNTDRATLKWRDLVAPATPIPTTTNADCTQCDPQPDPQPEGTVGLYEGAHYYHCGAFRPQFNCRMRQLNVPFCTVCQQRIRTVLDPFVPADGGKPGCAPLRWITGRRSRGR
jgi:hypothetical protein